MAETRDALKVEKLTKFIEETKADSNVASYYLDSTNWNVDVAIAGFKELKLAEERRIENRAVVNSRNEPRPATTGTKRSRGNTGPLRRGISMANSELVADAREKMVVSEFSNRLDTSFVLPNITIVKEQDLIDYLKNDLIDKATYQSLTKADVLNWWAGSNISVCRKLFPMSTVGDGNCLLHAVSLAMFGFHDRLLTLRKALHKSLTTESTNGPLKRRWMYQQWKLNMEAGGLSFTHQEWEDEWTGLVRLASDRPRSHHKASSPTRKISKQYSIAITANHGDGSKRYDSMESDSFESLEEFHVFALAHVLRRPIIVVSDVMLRDISGQPLQPIHFGGIYLPVECDPSTCCKFPVVLGYDSGHFAALVPAEGEDVATNKSTLLSNIPITRQSFELLPLHFIIDPGVGWTKTEEDSKKKRLHELSKQEQLRILSKYLHVTKVERSSKGVTIIPTFQSNDVIECELDSSDLGGFYRKKSKEGKPFVAKAFENITTLMMGNSNPIKAPSRAQATKSEQVIYTAKLNMANKPDYFTEMVENYIASARKKVQESKKDSEQQQPLGQQPLGRVKCATSGCSFFGSSDTNYLCSKCYRYQVDMSRVHKSMPSLQDDRPTLLKIAKRQLSQPEKVESDAPLIDFDSSITQSTPSLRPEMAPPQRKTRNEDEFASKESFDSMAEKVLFSRSSTSKPATSLPSIGQTLPVTTMDTNTRYLINDPLDEFDPLKTGHLRSDEKPFSGDFRLCRGLGCKFFGDPHLDGFCFSCHSRFYSKSYV